MTQEMRWVPAEATEEMLNATKGPGMSPGSWNGWTKKRHTKLYRQMVGAASDPWQPIETAPADTILLLAAEFDHPGDWRIKVGYKQVFDETDHQWHVFGASWIPTRWMPLPPTPKEIA